MNLVQLAQKYRDAEEQVNNYYKSIKDHKTVLFEAKMNHKFSLTEQLPTLKSWTKKRMQSVRVVVRNWAEVDQVFISIKDHGMRCRVLCDSEDLKVYATDKGLTCRTLDEESGEIATIAAANQGGAPANQGGE